MIYTSLAILAMSASAAVSPFSRGIHLHPHAKPVDSRINVSIYNQSQNFCELTVDGKTYTVLAHERLAIKAPDGTLVYAATRLPFTKVGEVVLQVSPKLNGQTVVLN